MAWISMRTDLRADPQVVTLVTLLGVTDLQVVGALHAAWCAADQFGRGDHARIVCGLGYLDAHVGMPGLSDAMEQVGWLRRGDGWIEFPNYLSHNSSTSKSRMLNALRQRRFRRKKAVTEVTPPRNASVTHVTPARNACNANTGEERRGQDKTRQNSARAISGAGGRSLGDVKAKSTPPHPTGAGEAAPGKNPPTARTTDARIVRPPVRWVDQVIGDLGQVFGLGEADAASQRRAFAAAAIAGYRTFGPEAGDILCEMALKRISEAKLGETESPIRSWQAEVNKLFGNGSNSLGAQ